MMWKGPRGPFLYLGRPVTQTVTAGGRLRVIGAQPRRRGSWGNHGSPTSYGEGGI